ncbi:MAG: 16S rRNA (cytosine(1402)-N(4))-methyltransferase RsmH [Candidatus Marinimicrobia bacterium]|nr:16S rRNA (cytosine(1402)-N(4))-methyltransferase RsmH [Candidatus Neomarinimicrobiota bacterium]
MAHTAAGPGHLPVMQREVIEWLITDRDGLYLDGTLGLGGHAAAILEALSEKGRLLAIELDETALALAKENLGVEDPRLSVKHGSYTQAPELIREMGTQLYTGVLLDLGISSHTLEGSGKGFSYRFDEPLDMRFDAGRGAALYDVLPRLNEGQITAILRDYGEERQARRLGRLIHNASKDGNLATSGDLAGVVRSLVKGPAVTKVMARVFQAFRIYINDELSALEQFLDQLAAILQTGGRAVIITFHSLEDRLVKQFFKRESQDCICPPRLPVCQCGHRAAFRVMTRKPLLPSADELAANVRSRSAKMRVAERI